MKFEPQTQQQWWREIEKHLKKDQADFAGFEVYPGIKYNTFASGDSDSSILGLLPRMSDFKTGASFTSLSNTNEAFLSTLNLGVQSLVIDGSEITEESSEAFNNIHWHYVTPIILAKGDHNLAKKLTQNMGPNLISDTHILTPYIPLISHENNDPIHSLVELCKGVKQQNFPSRLAVALTIESNFFFEIARIRALYTVLFNLYNNQETSLTFLEVIVHLDSSLFDDQDKDYGLIKQACAYLCAIIGGATIAVPMPWDNDNLQCSRQSINIGNLLTLESKIHDIPDPMAGSYFIEDLTKQVATNIWRLLDQ